MRRLFIIFLLLLCLNVYHVQAHANLIRSDPPANAAMAQSPTEIRLWFTEPLEPDFGRIVLRDSSGETVNTPPARVDPGDDHQLALSLDQPLPDGVYTVSWRVVSRADGHTTQGSFPMTVGQAQMIPFVEQTLDNSIPVVSAIVRWLNLSSMAMAVGGVGFALLVWSPAAVGSFPAAERRMKRLNILAWLFLGVSAVLMLMLQTSIVTGEGYLTSLPDTPRIIAQTRFGQLWLLRVVLWVGMGAALYMDSRSKWRGIPQTEVIYRVPTGHGDSVGTAYMRSEAKNPPHLPDARLLALLFGLGILLTHSLFSHASSESLVSVFADWLHMVGMAVWIGGLIQFLNALIALRREATPWQLGILVAHFSNQARSAVAMLMLTGIYAGWLHIGSLDGLLHTDYGRALLIKLALILPLLALAGVNLVFTARGLHSGQAVWSSRLRMLVGVEIALTISVLAAVGMMTAISPARSALADAPPQPEARPFSASRMVGGLQIDLDITPGLVGENTLTITLRDAENAPVDDASLIRARFDSLDQNIGQSELRPTFVGAGQYTAAGSNLSVPGNWRVRVTIQRPNQYDTLVDFEPTIPPPSLPAPVDPIPSLRMRQIAWFLLGAASIAAALFFLPVSRQDSLSEGIQQRIPRILLPGLLVIGGIVFLTMGTQHAHLDDTAFAAAALSPEAPVRMTISPNHSLPYLLTQDGRLLIPDAEGAWQPVPDAPAFIHDFYLENRGRLWVVCDTGLFVYHDGIWEQKGTTPAQRLVMSHGYAFALGAGAIMRVSEGSLETDSRLLDVPLAGSPAADLVMLGDHTHALLNGSRVYITDSLGLGWTELEAPAGITAVGNDSNGNLLASTDDRLMVWNWSSDIWHEFAALPDGEPITDLLIFQERLYATASGRLYRLARRAWQQVELDGGSYLTDLAQRYPDTLWALDSGASRLWYTRDGAAWSERRIHR